MAAGNATITVTARDPHGGTAATTYEADYGYIGADCNGSVTSRSEIVEATTTGTPSTGTPSFDIDLIFVGAISPKYRLAAEAAATRWESIITHSIPYHPVTEEERDAVEELYPTTTIPDKVDDLLILVEIDDNSGLGGGTLASAGHALLWSVGDCGLQCRQRGGLHRRENVLDDELMSTRFHPRYLIHNPLSAITIQAMADIGYRVDVIQAESYKGPFVTPFAASAPVVRAAEEDSVPLTCIVEGPTAMPDKPAAIILEVKRTVESE